MKRVSTHLLGVLALVAVAVSPMPAKAQLTGPISAAFMQGLVNVNVQDIANNLDHVVVVDVHHISVLDGAQIDVLRNGVIEVLSNNANVLNNWNLLNNALRDARLINGNQVAIGVGVLTGAVPIILTDRNIRPRP